MSSTFIKIRTYELVLASVDTYINLVKYLGKHSFGILVIC